MYVYDYNADTEEWTRSARLTAPQSGELGVLGRGIALDGNRIAVAASTYFKGTPGSVYVFERKNDAWERIQTLETIVTSQTWDALHEEPDGPSRRDALLGPSLLQDHDELSSERKAELLARRLRT